MLFRRNFAKYQAMASAEVLAQGPDGEEIDLSTIDMNAVALG
jgi:hypothetical protein